jgi:SAM-dependent methyltransferase
MKITHLLPLSVRKQIAKALGIDAIYARLNQADQENRLLRDYITEIDLLASGESKTPDGLPFPPFKLLYLIAMTYDREWFFKTGTEGAATVRDLLKKNGISMETIGSLLDFGCGCGRVLRHWNSLPGTQVFGSDYNPELLEWCQKNLPFATCKTNQLKPPLDFSDNSLDLIYAFSVFTHLTETLQDSWIEELHRVLSSEGLLIVTTHGNFYRKHLDEKNKALYDQGRLVVLKAEKAGENVCATYHPEKYVREKFQRCFHILDFIPEGAKGNPRQDIWLLQKKS